MDDYTRESSLGMLNSAIRAFGMAPFDPIDAAPVEASYSGPASQLRASNEKRLSTENPFEKVCHPSAMDHHQHDKDVHVHFEDVVHVHAAEEIEPIHNEPPEEHHRHSPPPSPPSEPEAAPPAVIDEAPLEDVPIEEGEAAM